MIRSAACVYVLIFLSLCIHGSTWVGVIVSQQYIALILSQFITLKFGIMDTFQINQK